MTILQEIKRKGIVDRLYNPSILKKAESVCQEVEKLMLDKDTQKTSFLIYADIDNSEISKLIKDEFGESHLEKIKLLKRMGTLAFPDSERRMKEMRKHFLELTNDLSVIFIKLAERLTELKFSEFDKNIDEYSIAEECLYLYSPIAHRLGISRIYNQMEDLSFKILYPDDFKRLNKIIEKRRADYERKLLTMKKSLADLLEKNNIEAQLQYRVKRLYSIFRKIRKKRIDVEEIHDLMALRVVTNSIENCYLTLGIVHNNWIPIEGRFRDWVSFPKPNGYRSIQTTIHTRKGNKFEIQIRTEEMHSEAEYGSAAHWSYKEGNKKRADREEGDKWILRLKEFLENDEYFDRPHDLLDLLNAEIKRNYISVLTPLGDIISLPEKSTPIDFAFNVHTELGLRTSGARVNGKFVKLNTELKSGDICDVISIKSNTPSRDWLNFVKTSRARTKILRWFKKHEEEQLIQDGKKTFDRFKSKHKKKLNKLEDEELSFRRNLINSGFNNSDDFFYSIGSKGLKCTLSLLKKLYPDAFAKEKKEVKTTENTLKKKSKSPRIKVEGLNNIETSLAKCCNPIKGEAILAYTTIKSGIKIHSLNCPLFKSGKLKEENIKTASWLDSESIQFVRIKIFGSKFNDMLKDLVDTADDQKLNVESTEPFDAGKKYSGLKAELSIKDINQFHNFIGKLKTKSSIDNIRTM